MVGSDSGLGHLLVNNTTETNNVIVNNDPDWDPLIIPQKGLHNPE